MRIAGKLTVGALPAAALLAAAVATAAIVPAGRSDSGSPEPLSQATGSTAVGAGVFVSAGCSSCHTLAALGAKGTVGPDLDRLRPAFDTVVNIVTYGAGPAMPSFRNRLSKREIRDLAAFVVAATEGRPVDLLPDLDVVKPQGLAVRAESTDAGRRVQLGFLSSTENVGPGPLAIRGERPSTDVPEMAVNQVVSVSDGTTRVNPDAGAIFYGEEATHDHWHLLPFLVYELRRAGDYRLVRTAHKVGFCLGDRYRAPLEKGRRLELPNAPPAPVFTGNCGQGDPDLLSIEEGISVGFGDSYAPYVMGQSIDITGLKPGRYYLVHRVNPDRLLAETSYANNVSSALISISRPRGAAGLPRVRMLSSCSNAERCEPRPR
jgi:mono/diheme cytochrome c family protein